MIKHVCSSDISVQQCTRKLKFRYYVNLPFINKMFSISLRLSDSVQCRKGLYFLAEVLYLCSFGTC